MAAYHFDSRVSVIARGLFSYLLLTYLIWFPLHLQTHESHAFIQSTQQDDKGGIPIEKESCQICDWWAHQTPVEAFATTDIILSCVDFVYHFPIYSLPYVEVMAQLSPRPPPVLE